MPENLQMLLRLKNVTDIVNKKINTENNYLFETMKDINDWNWIVKGKMSGTQKFTNLYNILSNKMKTHNIFVLERNKVKIIG